MQLRFGLKEKCLTDNQELKEYAEQLMRRQEQIINYRFEKQQEREERLKEQQRKFIDTVKQKDKIFNEKMKNSEKIKHDHFQNIVKVCKNRDKIQNKKIENIKIHQKRAINEAWRKAEQFNNQITRYQNNKHLSKQNTLQNKQDKSETHSIKLDEKILKSEERELQVQGNKHNLSMTINPSNIGKIHNISNMFNLTQYYGFQENACKPVEEKKNVKSSAPKEKMEGRIQNLKKSQEVHQLMNIQEMGQKLEKIDRCRKKRRQLAKKKKVQTEANKSERQFSPSYQRKTVSPKRYKKQNRTFDNTFHFQTKFKNWSSQNKERRDEAFSKQLEKGNLYLKNKKMKFLKTTLAKNIMFNAIQQKLFIDRMNC